MIGSRLNRRRAAFFSRGGCGRAGKIAKFDRRDPDATSGVRIKRDGGERMERTTGKRYDSAFNGQSLGPLSRKLLK
jgi:hypothetical protein